MKKLPNFIIVGAQKAGTTTLTKNLAKVADVYMANNNSIQGEPHFFNLNWERGIDWYQSLFITSKEVIGEKSPDYLRDYNAHSRMYSVVPDVKLIILLRNPADRAYSAWNHFNQVPEISLSRGWIITDFENAIFESDNERHQRLLFSGRYIDHIRHLLNYFSRDQMHFIISERLRKNPELEFKKVLNFIGSKQGNYEFKNYHERTYDEPMNDETRKKLEAYFERYNQRLCDFLGEDIPEWGIKQSSISSSKKRKHDYIIMLSSGRSGTHAIRSILAQNNQFKVFGETFNHDLQRRIEGDFTRFFERVIRLNQEWKFTGKLADELIKDYFKYLKKLANNLSPIIDIKDEQLGILDWSVKELDQPPRLLSHILKMNTPILRFTRKNRLAQYCSLLIARKTSKWVIRNDELDPMLDSNITIEKNELFKSLNSYEKSEELISKWSRGHLNFTRLYYEDCFVDGEPSEYLKKQLGKAIGIESVNVTSPETIKIVQDFRKHILNMIEVESWLKGTPYEKYLDMPG